MREVSSAILAQLALRTGLKVRNLLWIEARNRETGDPETIGIWNGDDVTDFVIDGDTRTYYGSGQFITFEDYKQEQGLVIHRLVGKSNAISPEMETVIRQYDTRLARVQMHLQFYDPLTDQKIGNPYRFFKGWIDTLPIKTGAKGEAGSATINMVGHARILTRLNPAKRSHETQRMRNGIDTFFSDVAITGTVTTPWGSSGVASAPNQGFGALFSTARAKLGNKILW